jgi:hypothetical protein
MKVYGGVDVCIHGFLISALVGGECSASFPTHFTWGGGGEGPQYTLDRRLGGPQSQSGLHGENSLPYQGSNSNFIGRPAHNQSLYQCTIPVPSELLSFINPLMLLHRSLTFLCFETLILAFIHSNAPSKSYSFYIENQGDNGFTV